VFAGSPVASRVAGPPWVPCVKHSSSDPGWPTVADRSMRCGSLPSAAGVAARDAARVPRAVVTDERVDLVDDRGRVAGQPRRGRFWAMSASPDDSSVVSSTSGGSRRRRTRSVSAKSPCRRPTRSPSASHSRRVGGRGSAGSGQRSSTTSDHASSIFFRLNVGHTAASVLPPGRHDDQGAKACCQGL
jgi:hypothetical protein